MSGEVRDRVAEAMTELSASERTAFVLRHFEGMCIEDVSRVLGCQPGAAKHSVFRAVQKLRRALGTLGECGQMNHLSEEQLILHYYGEPANLGKAGDTLAWSATWKSAASAGALRLAAAGAQRGGFSLPVPERSADYGARCGSASSGAWGAAPHALDAAGAVALGGGRAAFAALMVTAFVAGRFYPRPNRPRRWRRPMRKPASACCWWRWAIIWNAPRWCSSN
jgi:hypothetical protein